MSSNSFFVRSLFSFVLLLLLFLCFLGGLRLIIIRQLIRRRNMSIKSLQGRRHCCVFWIKRECTETVPLCWKINTVVSALNIIMVCMPSPVPTCLNTPVAQLTSPLRLQTLLGVTAAHVAACLITLFAVRLQDVCDVLNRWWHSSRSDFRFLAATS